jgi:hypothetical protein
MKIQSPFLISTRINTTDPEKDVIIAANKQGNAFVFLADRKQASTFTEGKKVNPSTDTKGIESNGSLTVVEFAKRTGMATGGLTMAQGIIVGRDALASMTPTELSGVLQTSPTVGLSPEWAESTAHALKGADSLVITRYATVFVALTTVFFGIGKAFWPKKPWWEVLLISGALAVSLVLLFWLGVYYGIFHPDTPAKP